MVTLDNIEEKHSNVINSDSWKAFLKKFKESDRVFVMGNGGMWAVGTHGGDDVHRLIHKPMFSLDSTCMLTSIANDYGYDQLYVKWISGHKDSGVLTENSLVVGLSCSGGSPNIINGLHSVSDFCHTALWSGHAGQVSEDVDNVVLDTNYFHVCEVLSLILFYELVDACGGSCPTISSEKARKGTE